MDNGSLYLDDFLSASGAAAYPCFPLNTESPTHSARRVHAAFDDVGDDDDDDDDDDDVDYDYDYNDDLGDDIASKISRTNEIQPFILRHLHHITLKKKLNSIHNVETTYEVTSTGRFIIFSVITNIYNEKTKGPTLMELFRATGKFKKFFLATRDVQCVHHG